MAVCGAHLWGKEVACHLSQGAFRVLLDSSLLDGVLLPPASPVCSTLWLGWCLCLFSCLHVVVDRAQSSLDMRLVLCVLWGGRSFSEGSAERWHSSLVLLEKPHWGPASLLSLSFLLFPVRVVAVRDLAGSQANAKGCWIGTSQMPRSQGGCRDLPLWVRSEVSFLWECKLCVWRHWRDFYPAIKTMSEHWVQRVL